LHLRALAAEDPGPATPYAHQGHDRRNLGCGALLTGAGRAWPSPDMERVASPIEPLGFRALRVRRGGTGRGPPLPARAPKEESSATEQATQPGVRGCLFPPGNCAS